MLIKIARNWQLPESATTPEALVLDRRQVLRGLSVGGVIAASPFIAACEPQAKEDKAAVAPDPSAGRYPVMRNPAFKLDREITEEKAATIYNNFYEFGSHKQISAEAQKLKIRPWDVRVDGMVKNEKTIAFDELLGKMPLEERLYRHRCVEAWSMAVPWSGFAFAALVNWAEPLSSAKYVRMETFQNPDVASGQKQSWYPWPYVEGLTMAEATNELAFLATGVYGKPLPKQMGAPLRLAVPWKYGFKSIKSIVRFTFTASRPASFWERIQPAEYGFWANVNPDVAHPRWSQKTEEVLGLRTRVPTLLYNGYGEQVAHLYKDLAAERLFT
jgi:sulfoxide reductase catalytic subunit YedY